jgi:hypothetical protein
MFSMCAAFSWVKLSLIGGCFSTLLLFGSQDILVKIRSGYLPDTKELIAQLSMGVMDSVHSNGVLYLGVACVKELEM